MGMVTGLIIIASIAGAAVSYVFVAWYYGVSSQRRKALQLGKQAALVLRRGADRLSPKEVEGVIQKIGELPYDVVMGNEALRQVWNRRTELGETSVQQGSEALTIDLQEQFEAYVETLARWYATPSSELSRVWLLGAALLQASPSPLAEEMRGLTEEHVWKAPKEALPASSQELDTPRRLDKEEAALQEDFGWEVVEQVKREVDYTQASV